MHCRRRNAFPIQERPRPSTLALIALVLSAPWTVRADSLASGIYVRTDSDDTLVVSPRAHATERLGETQLDLTYAADVWTSASIDIRTSASPPVTEQRDEIDVGLSQELTDLTLTGSYRYSQENDYSSNGGSLGGSLDFADNSATVTATLSYYRDSVGRSGDPHFDESLSTLGGRLALTQVLDTQMLAQVTYEVGRLDGYQASTYRFVGFGGDGYGCRLASLCLSERLPQVRLRHAAALLLRRALTDTLSVQAVYRYYRDDWSLDSHTASAEVDLFLADETLLSLRYRFYTQSDAFFYQPVYLTGPGNLDYWTRDRELSSTNDHRIGVDLDQRIDIDSGDLTLVLGASVGATFYNYAHFVGLDSVSALEVSFALGLEK